MILINNLKKWSSLETPLINIICMHLSVPTVECTFVQLDMVILKPVLSTARKALQNMNNEQHIFTKCLCIVPFTFVADTTLVSSTVEVTHLCSRHQKHPAHNNHQTVHSPQLLQVQWLTAFFSSHPPPPQHCCRGPPRFYRTVQKHFCHTG